MDRCSTIGSKRDRSIHRDADWTLDKNFLTRGYAFVMTAAATRRFRIRWPHLDRTLTSWALDQWTVGCAFAVAAFPADAVFWTLGAIRLSFEQNTNDTSFSSLEIPLLSVNVRPLSNDRYACSNFVCAIKNISGTAAGALLPAKAATSKTACAVASRRDGTQPSKVRSQG